MSFLISEEPIITRQGIAHPLAVSADLPAVSPIFIPHNLKMPCRTAPPTRLRRRFYLAVAYRNGTRMMVIFIPERRTLSYRKDGFIPIGNSFGNHHSEIKVIPHICGSLYSVMKRLGLRAHPIRDCPSAPLQNSK